MRIETDDLIRLFEALEGVGVDEAITRIKYGSVWIEEKPYDIHGENNYPLKGEDVLVWNGENWEELRDYQHADTEGYSHWMRITPPKEG